MPFISLATNKTVSKQQTGQLMQQLSALMAEETGKSESYVMVEISSGKDMQFSGKTDPLAYLECKSIGLTEAQAKSLSTVITQLLNSELQIPADRIYIEFSSCHGAFWGWNGGTFG